MTRICPRITVPMLLALALSGCAAQLDLVPADAPGNSAPAHAATAPYNGVLRVMTLNAAHSRGTGFHQMLQDGDTARANLSTIASVVHREAPDLLALQELDGPSFWSGGFDHAGYLSEQTGLAAYLRAENQKAAGLRYGTALMSRHQLADGEGFSFPARGVWPAKGFVVSTMRTASSEHPPVMVISLHLDPLRPKMRHSQLRMLAEYLDGKTGPTIVMGDFNCDWDEATCLPWFTDRMQLQAHNPDAPGPATFRFGDKRIDWVLVSPHFRFNDYRVLEDEMSDHRAVVAELHWNQSFLPAGNVVADGKEDPPARQVLSR